MVKRTAIHGAADGCVGFALDLERACRRPPGARQSLSVRHLAEKNAYAETGENAAEGDCPCLVAKRLPTILARVPCFAARETALS